MISDSGISLAPSATFVDCSDDLDILFVPGGLGTAEMMEDTEVLYFLRSRGELGWNPVAILVEKYAKCSATSTCTPLMSRRLFFKRSLSVLSGWQLCDERVDLQWIAPRRCIGSA